MPTTKHLPDFACCGISGLLFEFSGMIGATTAATARLGAAIGDVFFNGCASLVDILPTHLTGKLLTELDADRRIQTAIAHRGLASSWPWQFPSPCCLGSSCPSLSSSSLDRP